jgi:acetyl esterase/lipase
MRAQSYVYKTVPGCEIHADVYRGRADGAHAALIWIHGGCLMYGSREGISPAHLEAYLAAGWTIVSIDYRLAPETRLPAIVEDLQDAFRWVRARGPDLFGIDCAPRIAVVGHSAGGYLSLMAGCCVSPRPRAIVSFYGYGDIVGDWYSKPDPFYCREPTVSREQAYAAIGTAPNRRAPIAVPRGPRAESPIYLYCRQNGLWPNVVGGRDPAQEPEFFVPYCPVQNVDPDYPPTLLLHGDRDTDVPYEQSVTMAAELARQGVEHRLITIHDGPHGFDWNADDPQVERAFDAVLAFLGKHLGTA